MFKLIVSKDNNVVSFDGKNLDLSKLEFGVLYFILKNNTRIITREELYEKVWKTVVSSRSADVVMSKIRTKFAYKDIIVSKPNGYIFNNDIKFEIINDSSVDIKDTHYTVTLNPIYKKSDGSIVTVLNVAKTKDGAVVVVYNHESKNMIENVEEFIKLVDL